MESFKIIRHISFLIYELEFSININIHSVISIIHLKLIPKDSDLYNRPYNDYLISIKENP
jgi:hypothetical protein